MKPAKGTGGVLLAALLLASVACAGVRASPATSPAEELGAHLSGFIWPLPVEHVGHVRSPYGPRSRRHHDGLDLAGTQGDPIFAAGPGRVRFAGSMRGYGKTVVLEHDGDVQTLYAHASELYVRRDQEVSRGERIAAVGRTGNATGYHLHFEVRWNGSPIDPEPLLPLLAAR